MQQIKADKSIFVKTNLKIIYEASPKISNKTVIERDV